MLARNTILQSRYRIVRPLGKGGMGQVYEAIDDTVDSIVAIKETFANTDNSASSFAEGKQLMRVSRRFGFNLYWLNQSDFSGTIRRSEKTVGAMDRLELAGSLA